MVSTPTPSSRPHHLRFLLIQHFLRKPPATPSEVSPPIRHSQSASHSVCSCRLSPCSRPKAPLSQGRCLFAAMVSPEVCPALAHSLCKPLYSCLGQALCQLLNVGITVNPHNYSRKWGLPPQRLPNPPCPPSPPPTDEDSETQRK